MITEKLRKEAREWPKMDLEEFGVVFDRFEQFYEKYRNMDILEDDKEINYRRLYVYYQSGAKK